MDLYNSSFGHPAETSPKDVLEQFVGVFSKKGWLNRNVRIRHREAGYRISCSYSEFRVYRISDKAGLNPDASSRPVCVVTYDRIMENEALSGFTSTEPSAYEWLSTITDGKFELI